MAEPSRSTIKKLYTLSGNLCAFPGCETKVIEEGGLVGETCHIRGERPLSARHDPGQTDQERHALANLVVLCPTHHAIIDADPIAWPEERLISLKREHEKYASTRVPFVVSEALVDRVLEKLAQGVGIGAGAVAGGAGVSAASTSIVDDLNSLTRSIGDLLGIQTRKAPSPSRGVGGRGQAEPLSQEELVRLIARVRSCSSGYIIKSEAARAPQYVGKLRLFSDIGWPEDQRRDVVSRFAEETRATPPAVFFWTTVRMQDEAALEAAARRLFHVVGFKVVRWEIDPTLSARAGFSVVRGIYS